MEESEDYYNEILNYPKSVQDALKEIMPSSDVLDDHDFDAVQYINSLFPTEQSLSNIDDVILKMESNIKEMDEEIETVVRSQSRVGQDGKKALEESQKVIMQLFSQVRDIKSKAEKSEEMVREITRDIKLLDTAKRNLTTAITCLNHLHMLVTGVHSLRNLIEQRQYGEIVMPLQGVIEVMKHFQDSTDIPQILELRSQVVEIQNTLSEQITQDLKNAFQSPSSAGFVPSKQIAEALRVVSILDPKVKKNILEWFISLQLSEYLVLFDESEDSAWLDKIDKRYAWFKKQLLHVEDKFGTLFPPHWQLSEKITIEFCERTRSELGKIMAKRKFEIDVKLLLYAIQKTSNFEQLLEKRFADDDNAVEENKTKFEGIIGSCFQNYLYIYIESLDRNLNELIDRFAEDSKQVLNNMNETCETSAAPVLPSCADLFMFYKKSLVQCTQLSTGEPMVALATTFQQHLRHYAHKVLQQNVSKQAGQTTNTTLASVSNITRDLGLIKDQRTKYTPQEQARICCVLTTAEYCLETTQQLEQKLKEKVDPNLMNKIDLSNEQDVFHNVISSCIQLLVQDLELACEPALTAMVKTNWSSVESVGDQSGYVTAITSHLKQSVPLIRTNLSSSRKYFTQFCVKFANSFIPKLVQHVFKCKPLSTVGAEQLLLDIHMLKTVLLDLPSIGSQVVRKAPASYTKVVVKGMTKAEMILKLVMASAEPDICFIEQFCKLLPESDMTEFQRILDMKGLKTNEKSNLINLFRPKNPSTTSSSLVNASSSTNSFKQDTSSIQKLNNLIKKNLI
ncbi:hypothetical protein WDU94_008049 [Cyamophila willieti]